MSDNRPALFDEVARIEEQAERILADAKAEARALRRGAEEQIRALVEETERAIEQKRAELAEEYKVKTAHAMAQIEADFLEEEKALNAVRERHFDDLVERALCGLRRSLLGDVGGQKGNGTMEPG